MAIAPIANDLLKLLSPTMQAALKAELEANENARKMLEEGLTFRDAYLNGEDHSGEDAAACKS